MPEQAAAFRTVQQDGIALAGMQGWDDKWLAILDEPDVTDKRLVDNRIDDSGVV